MGADRDLNVCRRSILGLVSVYNLLPEYVVQANSVSRFQNKLHRLVKTRALSLDVNWDRLFSPRWSYVNPHPLVRLSAELRSNP